MTKGERIKNLRILKGMSQEELAKRLETTKQTISKYEKNIVTNIPSDRIEAMAKVLESTPEYILGWIELTEEKDNEAMSDIIVRMRMDSDFLSVVESLYSLNGEQLKGVKQMLNAFLK